MVIIIRGESIYCRHCNTSYHGDGPHRYHCPPGSIFIPVNFIFNMENGRCQAVSCNKQHVEIVLTKGDINNHIEVFANTLEYSFCVLIQKKGSNPSSNSIAKHATISLRDNLGMYVCCTVLRLPLWRDIIRQEPIECKKIYSMFDIVNTIVIQEGLSSCIPPLTLLHLSYYDENASCSYTSSH